MSEIILIGGGGHCRSVIDVLEMCKQPIAGIVHGEHCALEPVLGYAPLGRDADLKSLFSSYTRALITLGQIKTPKIRQRLFVLLTEIGFTLPHIVSPLAYCSRHASVGRGSILMHQALVNAGTVIGDNCIINTKALIEHECTISDHCHVAIGATLCGNVRLGEGAFVGANATIMQGITIGKNSIVGMGVTVKRDVADGEVYA